MATPNTDKETDAATNANAVVCAFFKKEKENSPKQFHKKRKIKHQKQAIKRQKREQ